MKRRRQPHPPLISNTTTPYPLLEFIITLSLISLQSPPVTANLYSCSFRTLIKINTFAVATRGLGFPPSTYLGSPFRDLSRLLSTMALTSDSNGPDEVQARAQQSPLASQRAKQESNSGRNGQAAKAGGFFTLGYKEGFSQWVSI